MAILSALNDQKNIDRFLQKPVAPAVPVAPITPTQSEPTAKNSDRFDFSMFGVGTNGVVPLFNRSKVKPVEAPKVDASNLNTQGYQLPAPVKDNTASAKIASTNAMVTTPTTPATTPTTPAPQTEQSKVIAGINNILGIQEGKSDFIAKAQEDVQLEKKRIVDQEFTAKAVNAKKSYEDKIKKVKENIGGMSAGQLENAVSQLESKANEDLANIAIQKSVAQGDVTLALQIVKDKVEAKYEPLKNQLETYKMQFQMLQNDMSDSDKAQASKLEKQLDRQYEREVASARSLEAYKLEALKAGIVSTGTTAREIALEISQKMGQNVSAGTIDAYSLANTILNLDYGAITGVKGVTNYLPGTDAQYTKNQFKQLKAYLSLENRSKLKGSGAISDFEAKSLEQASSALDTNLSNESFGRELRKIRGALGNAAGLKSNIKLSNPMTGEVSFFESDRAGINAAIKDGLVVEYI